MPPPSGVGKSRVATALKTVSILDSQAFFWDSLISGAPAFKALGMSWLYAAVLPLRGARKTTHVGDLS